MILKTLTFADYCKPSCLYQAGVKSILAHFQVLSWMILKTLVLKKFKFDKGSSLFQPISEWTKNARAAKICCCSHVFCVYYYLYKLKCNYFFWKKHDIPANNNHERSDNSLSWSADPRWSLEGFKILIFRRTFKSLFYRSELTSGVRPSRPKINVQFTLRSEKW